MTDSPLPQDQLLPRPRRVRRLAGRLPLGRLWRICTAQDNDPLLIQTVRMIRRLLEPCGLAADVWQPLTRTVRFESIHCRRTNDTQSQTILTLARATRGRGDQWYNLQVRPRGILLRAGSEAGFRYGILSLRQLLQTQRSSIPAMDIEDWPDFAVRGVMLDISRNKVPTLTTLKRLIDMLASWRINHIQLYMEHTFAYPGHEPVWRGSSPLTGPQIRDLDRFCRQRCVELVPNQNSLSHLGQWLARRPYSRLAECTGSWRTPWGEVRRRSTTLNPIDPGSIRLVSSLYDQLLPHFSSGLFNVGCDEPWELGQGRSGPACRRRGPDRVYLDYLLKVRRAAARHRRRILFWSDWLDKYPGLISELPDDVVPLVWGYEADHPFDRPCARLQARGLDFYVCPGTSSWCSFGGRTDNALANLRHAAESGRRHRAAGYLVTDWGDFGHHQYLPVSYAGFAYGAALGWCVAANADLDADRSLDRHVFCDTSGKAGRLWLEAGRVHHLSRVVLNNRTVLFAVMQAPLGDVASVEGLAPGAAERMADRTKVLIAETRRVRFGGPQADLVKEELLATLKVLRHAARRAQFNVARRTGRRAGVTGRWLASDMRQIIDRHRALWLARNRRGGLAASLAHYQRNLMEYQALSR